MSLQRPKHSGLYQACGGTSEAPSRSRHTLIQYTTPGTPKSAQHQVKATQHATGALQIRRLADRFDFKRTHKLYF